MTAGEIAPCPVSQRDPGRGPRPTPPTAWRSWPRARPWRPGCLRCSSARLCPPGLAGPDGPLPEPIRSSRAPPQELLKNWKQWLHETPPKAKLKVARYPMRDELALIRLLLDRRPNQAGAGCEPGLDPRGGLAFCGHLGSEPHRVPGRPVRRLRGHRLRRQPHRHAGGAGRAAGPGQDLGAHPQLRAWCSSPPCSGPWPLRGPGDHGPGS